MGISRHLRRLLWLILALSGCIIAARAVFGPFHLGVIVSNPIKPEAYFALTALTLLLMQSKTEQQKPAMTRSSTTAWALLILALAGIAAWAWSFRFPFIADDYDHIANANHANAWYLARLVSVPAADRFFRPLSLAAYAAQARVLGMNRIGWHLSSFALHLSNAGLLFWLARKRGYAVWISWAAAAVFLLHGARPEAVTWIAAQFDLWATFFFLLSILTFLRYTETSGLRWQIASLASLLLALLSKESAYVLPLVMVLIVWVDRPAKPPRAVLLGPPFALTALVFLYRWHLLHGIGGYQMPGTGASYFYSVSLFRTGKALFLRLPAVLLFPVNWTRPPAWWLVLGLTGITVAMGALVLAKPSRKQAAFAAGLVLLAAIPVHQFLLIGPDLEKSRVSYLPSLGFALLFASGLAALRPRVAAIAAGLMIVGQVTALEHNLRIWQSVAQLADQTCRQAASLEQSAQGPLVISDVPNVVDGVYFLHTGLKNCVEWAAGKPLPRAFPKPNLDSDPPGTALVWNGHDRKFTPTAEYVSR